jgi:hypothetical protein
MTLEEVFNLYPDDILIRRKKDTDALDLQINRSPEDDSFSRPIGFMKELYKTVKDNELTSKRSFYPKFIIENVNANDWELFIKQ